MSGFNRMFSNLETDQFEFEQVLTDESMIVRIAIPCKLIESVRKISNDDLVPKCTGYLAKIRFAEYILASAVGICNGFQEYGLSNLLMILLNKLVYNKPMIDKKNLN